MFGFLNFFKSSKRDKSKALAENNALPLSDFEQLPRDVIGHVLSYVLPEDLRAVRGANKTCRALIDDNPKILSDCIENLLECYQAKVHEQITKDFPGASEALKDSACYLVGVKEDSPFKVFMSTWVCQEREMLDLLSRTVRVRPLFDEEKGQLKALLEDVGKNEYTLENLVARNDLLNTINDRLISGAYGFVARGVSVGGMKATRLGPDLLSRLEEKDSNNQPFFLDLSENRLRALPPLLSTLSNVTELDVWNNELGVVPEFAVEMSSLTGFLAHGNKIVGLSKETEGWLKSLGEDPNAFLAEQKPFLDVKLSEANFLNGKLIRVWLSVFDLFFLGMLPGVNQYVEYPFYVFVQNNLNRAYNLSQYFSDDDEGMLKTDWRAEDFVHNGVLPQLAPIACFCAMTASLMAPYVSLKLNKMLHEMFDKKSLETGQDDDVNLNNLRDAKDYLLGREVLSPTIARWKVAAFPESYSPAFTMGLNHRLLKEPSRVLQEAQRKLDGVDLPPRSIRFCG